ncbi:hypothetical protein HDF15_001141 [Granulicella mallensis]|nr:hypothetical protein [Granulicella mallensis]MBB5062804.1 hypothetical protein [Granulicella mallensis]
MGGLIAESAVWESFTDDWQTVLDEYIGGKWFHMKDYVMVPGVGPYVGWDESKRREFLGKLVNAIVSRNIRYVGCVVSIDGFDALPPQLQEGFVDPYYMAFQHATHGCSICGLNIEDPFSPEKVAMVYAYQDTFGAINSGSALPRNQGRAEQLWHAMKSQNTMFSAAMESYASDFPKNIQALQAADLFAYELTHYFENLLRRPKDGMRWALRQMLADKKDSYHQPLLKFYSLESMLETLMNDSVIPENVDVRIAASMLELQIKMDMQDRIKA